MAHAVTVAPEPAAEAAQQQDDHDDDEYRSERHGILPKQARRMKIRRAAIEDKAYSGLWFHRGNPARLFRLQFQRCRIDAVAQAGRAGPVVKHVSEMAVAFRTKHLGPDHAVADVAFLVDMALGRRLGKARPAAAGIELGVGFEQRLPTAGADVGAGPLLMLIFAGERPLGRLLA